MVVVCCISPSSKYIQETQSTLHFALRAKLVKTNANINETVEGADAAAQLKVELGRSRNESNSLNEQLREQKTMIYALKEEIDELKKQHAEELGRSRSEVHALEGQLRELKASTALREHKSEITNIATSANDDDCQTFEKYASLADNSTTDFGYSDSKDNDISIKSDCSNHCESINFSEEEEKTMLMNEEKVMEAEEEVINVCDFGGYGIEEENDDITITNSTSGTPANTRCSGTSCNHSVIDLCDDEEEYIDNKILEIENDNEGIIVPTAISVYDQEVKEIEDDVDKNEELEFLDLDETNGISTTTSRTSIATIASLCGSHTSTNLGNCEEEEAKEDGNGGRDNSRFEEYEWSEEDGSSKTNNFIDKEFEFNKDDNSYGTCEEEEEEEEDGNDGRDNSDAEEYEWSEEDGSSKTRKSLNKRTSIDAIIYCGSRRCSTVIHEEQEVDDKEDDNDSKDAEFEFDKDDDSTNGTSQSKEDNSDEEVECDEDDGSNGSSPIHPTKKKTRTDSTTTEDSGLTKNAVIQQPSSSSRLPTKRKYLTWNERFEHLIEFKKANGHCNVPQRYDSDPSFGIWVNKQRDNYKIFHSGRRGVYCGGMNQEKIDRLDGIGFVKVAR
jgi:hypothetical protein